MDDKSTTATERLRRIAAVWGFTHDEAAHVVGGDDARAAQLARATELLMTHVELARIPAVVRRGVDHLDGHSLLALVLDRQLTRVVSDLEYTFDIGRVQP